MKSAVLLGLLPETQKTEWGEHRNNKKKRHIRCCIPIIKHLLEQAESKRTADKENITKSQKPDSF